MLGCWSCVLLPTNRPSRRREELASAPFPLMLLAGEKDAVLSPATVRRAGELLPSARVEVVTGAPHSMYWETPQLFNDVVASFLRDVAAG